MIFIIIFSGTSFILQTLCFQKTFDKTVKLSFIPFYIQKYRKRPVKNIENPF